MNRFLELVAPCPIRNTTSEKQELLKNGAQEKWNKCGLCPDSPEVLLAQSSCLAPVLGGVGAPGGPAGLPTSGVWWMAFLFVFF